MDCFKRHPCIHSGRGGGIRWFRDGRGWSDNRRDNGGRFDRGRNFDRGDRNWQRRSNGRYDSRAYYAPRYYRYTPPRPWYWTQPRPGYFGYYDYGY